MASSQSNTKSRAVRSISEGAPEHMVGDGFRVRNHLPFTDRSGKALSPFYLLDYHAPFVYPATTNQRRGVGPHPHRGLETITLAFSGAVAHHDSAGNSGVIGPGDVQWMTAGSGILHKEYHGPEFANAGGELHMLQLWTNLPKKHKMTQPRYQGILASQMGVANLDQTGSHVQVIAGSYQGVRGPAQTFSPMDLFVVKLNQDAAFAFSPSATANVGVLVVKGNIELSSGQNINHGELVQFDRSQGEVRFKALSAQSMAVVMSGEPIDEPLVQYGPFLMNSKEEIIAAIDDFESGKFGELLD